MRRAVVVGIEYFARYLTTLMNEHSEEWRFEFFPRTRLGTMRALWRLRDADALISFGGPTPTSVLTLAARERGIPLVLIWAGSDLLVAAKNPVELEVTKRLTHADLAGAPWLAQELRDMGIPAQYQPIIGVDTPARVAPLPQRFTVLSYLPAPRREFYGEDRVYALARTFKTARFLIVGAGKRNPNAPSNVEFLGFRNDMGCVIDDSCVLVRLPEHDGPAMMVLEALARGRHAIWTYDAPGVICAPGTNEATAALRDLLQRHARGELGINTEGRRHVATHCTRAGIAASFEGYLAERVPPRPDRAAARKRVAISGLGLFCADVAEKIEQLRPDWKAEILRPRSRMEILTSLARLSRADVWYSIGTPFTDRYMHLCAKTLRIPRVMHWVGSDLESVRASKSLQRIARQPEVKHLTEIEWTARELEMLGMSSEVRPLPLRQSSNGVKPLPEQFTILLYVPKSRPEFYGAREYERLMSTLAGQGVRVFVVGGAKLRALEGIDLVDCGWRSDLRDIYERSTVLIRCTPHDGLSLMVLEALSFGRYAIWSKPFPGATRVGCYRELEGAVLDLLHRHQAGELHAQYSVAEMVRVHYDSDRCVRGILNALDSAQTRRLVEASA
jgi:hypothetical protein